MDYWWQISCQLACYFTTTCPKTQRWQKIMLQASVQPRHISSVMQSLSHVYISGGELKHLVVVQTELNWKHPIINRRHWSLWCTILCIKDIFDAVMLYQAWTKRMHLNRKKEKKVRFAVVSLAEVFSPSSDFDVTYSLFHFDPLDCVLCSFYSADLSRELLKNVSSRSTFFFVPPLVVLLGLFKKHLECRFPSSVSGVVPFDLCCAQLFSPLYHEVPLVPFKVK